MDLPSTDIVQVFLKLLPGFLAAAVFHALTPYPKRDALERVTIALIFTMLAQLGVTVVRPGLLLLGRHFAIGHWGEESELAVSAGIALLLGVCWAHAVNNDWTHWLVRKTKTTKRTSLPMDWFAAFAKYERYIVIHFKDGRRLMGWPLRWPDRPTNGHFLLERPKWVMDDGSYASMHQIEYFLVSAKEVEAVEFLRFSDDPVLASCQPEIEEASAALEKARKDQNRGKSTGRPKNGREDGGPEGSQ